MALRQPVNDSDRCQLRVGREPALEQRHVRVEL